MTLDFLTHALPDPVAASAIPALAKEGKVRAHTWERLMHCWPPWILGRSECSVVYSIAADRPTTFWQRLPLG